MVILKRLTQTLLSGETTLVFTDPIINANSIIEIYLDNAQLYPTDQQQTGEHSITVTFDQVMDDVEVVMLVNNIISMDEPVAPPDELNDLDDVDITDPQLGDVFLYNGTKWSNGQIPTPPTPDAADISYDNSDSGLIATDVQDAIDEVFQSVSDGKDLIADAITDKGVPTSATDTFATMATNISNIPSGGGSALDDMLTALGFNKIEHATYTVVHGTITNNSGTQINGYANKNMLRIDVNANVKRVVAIVKADAAVINRAGCTSHRSALDQTSGYSQDPSGTRGLMYSITATDEAMIIGTGGYYQSGVTTRYVYLEVSSADVSANTFDVTLYWRG